MTKEEALTVIWLRCQHNDKTYEAYCVLKREHEQEPCEDAISRQAAINACLNGWNKDYKEIVEKIRTLPPATPKQKMGHWIDITNKNGTVIAVRCSRCKKSPKHAIKKRFLPEMWCKDAGGGGMNIGDRVKFKTIGGWYNSGIIKDMNKDSYLIEVDKSEDPRISLPYYARVLSSCEIISENLGTQESEVQK